jgi:hypothetical protein
MKIKMTDLVRFVNLTSGATYHHLRKEECRKLGKKILKALAELMGLQKGEFDIRWNPGGIACRGDHTLHTDWFYLALHDNLGSGWFYYRKCKSRKDYCGERNIIVYWPHFTAHGLEGLKDAIERDCPRPIANVV